MPIALPQDLVTDIRDPIPGDSYTWEGIEPAPAKKQIVIHGTASQGHEEDGFTMAEYHMGTNGWPGIGVHFVVTKDSYPGRPGITLPGAQVQYVGDLLSWRAGVYGNNPGKVHIEISGLFTPGNGVPSEAQLRKTRRLIEFLLAPNQILPSLNYGSQVTYHDAIALPDHHTECPGWQHPQFQEWFSYLQTGKEPSWFSLPAAPVATPVILPAPPTVPVAPTQPEWVRSWTPDETIKPKIVAVPSADVFDFETGQVVKQLTGGEPVNELVGYFTVNHSLYVRSRWSRDNNKWNGILLGDLRDRDSLPGMGGTAPVDAILAPAPPQPQEQYQVPVAAVPSPEAQNALAGFWEALGGIALSPLRLIKLLTNLIQGLKS